MHKLNILLVCAGAVVAQSPVATQTSNAVQTPPNGTAPVTTLGAAQQALELAQQCQSTPDDGGLFAYCTQVCLSISQQVAGPSMTEQLAGVLLVQCTAAHAAALQSQANQPSAAAVPTAPAAHSAGAMPPSSQTNVLCGGDSACYGRLRDRFMNDPATVISEMRSELNRLRAECEAVAAADASNSAAQSCVQACTDRSLRGLESYSGGGIAPRALAGATMYCERYHGQATSQ